MNILKLLCRAFCTVRRGKKCFVFLVVIFLLTLFFNQNSLNVLNDSMPAYNNAFRANILSHSSHNFEKKTSRRTVEFINLPTGNFCDDDSLLVVLTKSTLYHIEQRDAIRKTWANINVKNAKVFFLLGLSTPDKENINQNISEEAAKHNDIIQGGFIDAYYNLTRKTLMGFEWVNNYCSNARLVLSADDDTVVDINNVLQIYNSTVASGLLECGRRLLKRGLVRRSGKWAVPESIYKADFYPPYCSGDCYIMSADVAKDIFLMSLKTNVTLTFDDVVISGIIREKVGVEVNKIQRRICYNVNNAYKNICEKIYQKWAEIKKTER